MELKDIVWESPPESPASWDTALKTTTENRMAVNEKNENNRNRKCQNYVYVKWEY